MAYKLNPVASWGWNLAPVLYKNGSAHKIGTDAFFAYGTINLGGFISVPTPISSGMQRYVQNSFIVYLNANDNVQAGYNVKVGPTFSRAILGASSVSGIENYFSISLLNKAFE